MRFKRVLKTTCYRVTINKKTNIAILTKPLEEAQYFQNPEQYCQYSTVNMRLHFNDDNTLFEYYFPNYQLAKNFLLKSSKKYEIFNTLEK